MDPCLGRRKVINRSLSLTHASVINMSSNSEVHQEIVASLQETLKAYVERTLKDMMLNVHPRTQTTQARRTRVDRMDETRQWFKKAVESLPRELNQKGWLLVQYLDQNRLMLDSSGAFIPQGHRKAIEGSHINDLMKYALRKSGKEAEPPGFPMFIQQLKSYGVGTELISPRHFSKKKKKKPVPMDIDPSK